MFTSPTNLIIGGASTLGLIWIFILQIRFNHYKKRLILFSHGSQARNIEQALTEQLSQCQQCQRALGDLADFSQRNAKIAGASIHKVALIRFNPFDKVGSDQSFSIAFLNQEHTGLVMSSLYAQSGCRIYAKPILRGKSQYPLSAEEIKAITKAISV
ncbi:MAG: hypothetical protein COS76_04225 [Candidatus Portnoybacteria bacterium CG06_land_8_20_14_3_00_39_12]|uniref:DUF4446 domain-containing protein n=2 Tax=Candidatus Portnoyibacteriota TaxID=1817913 RepID=A0A2M7UK12_9BACT|nr:MAG: hypothetical protein AUJ33_02535 [Parcubacteria group bacterium CG1_02_40_25]PIU74794.1 MAG: hypothetical protein COS76_04225 [Candidatus Portnoybacteria bacterium CG06_land_8_20_14_3_00_39_12]PIZ71558.1 MAG: hypothetical protein COY09_00475 [Candidatus Portnoybacteria bacterium CG_4_10_14_0_2_um_filter_39_11]